MTTSLDTIAVRIINEQELVMGPLAWSEAEKVQGMKIVSRSPARVEFLEADQKLVIDRLVAQYERLFGRASQEVCKDAVANLIASLPRSEVPTSLLT